jgi:hypothetical protein
MMKILLSGVETRDWKQDPESRTVTRRLVAQLARERSQRFCEILGQDGTSLGIVEP